MKKLSILALTAVGLLFGACSSNDDVTAQNGTVEYGEGDGYLALSINLPTTPAVTRAANDVYDDGIAAEYKVSDACLLLFTGASEALATLMYAQPLTLPFPDTDADVDNDNITTSYQTVAEVKGTLSGNLYALVCLNYKNVFTIASGKATSVATGNDVTTLASIQSTAAEIVDGNQGTTKMFTNKGTSTTSNYFFMTNAVQQYATDKSTAPTAAQILTLAPLDKTKIYKTEAEAKANPAGDVYVERAVAKATLSFNSSVKIPGTVGGTSTPLAIGSVEWAIDNMEPKSFIVRNPGDKAYIAYTSEAFGATKVYRFVGDTKMGQTTKLHNYDADIYRTYWCVDPQYEAAATGLTAATGYVSTSTPLYCNENTFNVANQLYKNTTRAVIKVTPETKADFYTVNGGQERYSEADAKSFIITDIVDNADFQAAVKACLLSGKSYTFSAASITPTWAAVDAKGQVKIQSVAPGTDMTDANFNMTALAAAFAATPITDVVSAANDNFKVLKYTDGIVYYEARFQHFANTAYEKSLGTFDAATAQAQGDLAPWNCWETTKPSATTAYPANTKSAEENYLGRYGMVRNNWYDVSVTALNKLGSPVSPAGNVENPETPDDNVLEYISVKIHVLSWAKRTQSWSF